MKERILVAMSGGVDSSLAAALLCEQGHSVAGAIMDLVPEDPAAAAVFERNRQDAEKVCDALGIGLAVVDLREEFSREVMEPFVEAYLQGQTPNPCVLCNPRLKFGHFLDYARQQGFDRVATGHYVQLRTGPDGSAPVLACGRDPRKDQSYFLYRVAGEQLAAAVFPVGGMTKAQVQQRAREKFPWLESRPESQEVCFIPGDDYRVFLQDRCQGRIRPGPFLDREGNPIGEHRGIPFYTVGQRRGLGLSLGYPAYVCRIDPARDAVVVGPREALETRQFSVGDTVFAAGRPPAGPQEVRVKVRYRSPAVEAVLLPQPEEGGAVVQLDAPAEAVTPGQSAVFYQGDEVLGGGIIEPPKYWSGGDGDE